MSSSERPTASIIELATDPGLVRKAVEKERAARRGGPGWLGITPRYNAQAILKLGDAACEAQVHERSPAYRAGIRTGDLIEAMTVLGLGIVHLDNLESLGLRAGTELGIKFLRPNATGRTDAMAVVVKLAPWPRNRSWEVRQRVAAGARVKKTERPKFLAEMLDYLREVISSPHTRALAYCYLSALLLKRDNERHDGVWESYGESAKSLGVTARTVNDLALTLRHFGVLKLIERPTPKRNSNLVQIVWPDRNKSVAPARPVPFPPPARTRRVRL
jgi:hypothetical protein